MMNFYERYEKLCQEHEIKPCAQTTADKFNVTRATVSHWKDGTTPNGSTVRAIADAFGVTTDYLLCRTDDPTDYAHLNPNRMKLSHKHIIELYERLDATDKVRIEAYMEGILTGEKYARKKAAAL